MKNAKILESISYYFPYISGLTLYAKRLAEALVKKRYRVSVLTSQYNKRLAKEECINGVKVTRVPVVGNLNKGAIMPSWILATIENVLKNDIIIINLPEFEGFVPAIVSRILGKKVISIYHCEIIMPKGIINKIAEKIIYICNLITMIFSDKIITYTKDYAENVKLLKHFKKKQEYIYPPIEYKKIKRNKQKFLAIGFAGRLATEKGIEYLLEAIPKIKGKLRKKFKILIAAPEAVGEIRYSREIKKLFVEYKKNIEFLGPLSAENMPEFYSKIDLLVLPSLNSTESFGMVQVEAMFQGVPVIASDLPGVRVPVQKTGMGEIVPLKDSEAIANAVVKISNSKKKYMKKEKARRIFDIKNTIKFYETLFINLTKKK